MKYLIHYNYYKNGERMFDWAWTDKNASAGDLLSIIDRIKERDMDVKFNGIYPLPDSQENILYSQDGAVDL